MDSAWFNAKYGGDVGERLREASWVLQQRRSLRVSKSSLVPREFAQIFAGNRQGERGDAGHRRGDRQPRAQELREVLSRLNVPDKAAEGLIVDLGEALLKHQLASLSRSPTSPPYLALNHALSTAPSDRRGVW